MFLIKIKGKFLILKKRETDKFSYFVFCKIFIAFLYFVFNVVKPEHCTSWKVHSS